MMSQYALWYEHPWAVIDTETTGVSHSDTIVQLGVVRYELGLAVGSYSTLLQPGRPIPPQASAVHGIYDHDVRDAPSFAQALPRIVELCSGAWPVAFNASFDRRMLFQGLAKTSLTGLNRLRQMLVFDPEVRWFDPLVWERALGPGSHGRGRVSNKLGDVCARYGVPLDKGHDACSDATAAGQVLWKQSSLIGDMTACEMLRRQALREAEWESARGYR